MWMSVNVGLPNSLSWGFMDTTRTCASFGTPTIYSHVWMNEREGGMVKGKYKLILWMLWHHKVEDNHSHRVFRPWTGAPQNSQTSTSTQGDAWKGHLHEANQRPSKSKTSIDRGQTGKRARKEKNNKQVNSVIFHKEIVKVTAPLLNHLGEVYCRRLGY